MRIGYKNSRLWQPRDRNMAQEFLDSVLALLFASSCIRKIKLFIKKVYKHLLKYSVTK